MGILNALVPFICTIPVPVGVRLILPLGKLVDTVVLANVKLPRLALAATDNVMAVTALPLMVLLLTCPALALTLPLVEMISPERLMLLAVTPLIVMLPTEMLPVTVRLPRGPTLVING